MYQTVLFDYLEDTQEEITVNAGDTVTVIEEGIRCVKSALGTALKVAPTDDGSGWTSVSNGSRTGIVPSSYLELN
jgi:hypothetical protein